MKDLRQCPLVLLIRYSSQFYIKFQIVPHEEHSPDPLEIQISPCCLRKSVFIRRILWIP